MCEVVLFKGRASPLLGELRNLKLQVLLAGSAKAKKSGTAGFAFETRSEEVTIEFGLLCIRSRGRRDRFDIANYP